LGLAQNVVDLLIANQLGAKRPVFMVLAMNEQLWQHPRALEHRKTLEEWGVDFYPTPTEEERLKVPDSKEVAQWLAQQLK